MKVDLPEPCRGIAPPAVPEAMRPLWSVMIPTFNCADLLAQTLKSVLASGYPAERMQIEVVDDCSTTDDPQRVVEALGEGRVGFFRQPRNLGHARNFNSCLDRSRGRLVHVLHGDDWVRSDFYPLMDGLFARFPEIGAAFCRHVVTNDDGSPQRVSPLERGEPGVLPHWLETIAAELRLQPPSMVVRREVYEHLGGFDTRMKSCGEDWEMWVRIAAHYPVGYVPETLAYYRDRGDSLTKRSIRTGQNIRDVRMATKIVRSHLPPGRARVAAARKAGATWGDWALFWADGLISRGDYRGAAVQLHQAFLCSRSPDSLRKIARTGRRGLRHAWERSRASKRPAGSDTTDRSGAADVAHGHRRPLEPVPDGQPRPLWSVMIPTFNCAHYLRETLASVLAQDPGPALMQIEVVDDCSTKDDPEAVVAEVGRGRVQFFRRSANGGHSANFRTCLERSRGHLVHLLHGDDAVRTGFYEKLGGGLASCPEAGAAFCRHIYMDENSHWTLLSDLERAQSGILEGWLERIALRQRIQTPSIVVRRQVYEILGTFDDRLSWVEDWEMWARIAARYPVWYEVEPLALYRMHGGSNSSRHTRTGENMRDVRRAVDLIQELLHPTIAARLRREALEFWALDALENRAPNILAAGDVRTSLVQIQEAVRCSRSPAVMTRATRLALKAAAKGARHSLARAVASERRGPEVETRSQVAADDAPRVSHL